MKRQIHRVLPVLAGVLLATPALASEDAPTLDDLAFMTGSWEARAGNARLEEHITAPDAGSMVGTFRWIEDGATAFTEHLVFEERDDGVHLFLRHFHPGNIPWEAETDAPMRFRLAEAGDGRAVFSDPTITFPTRLIYHRTRPDTLVVRLEGHHEDGRERSLAFDFRSTSMTTTPQTLTEAGQSMGYNAGLTIAMHVSDLAAAIAWYQDVVGFKLQYHLEEMGWCELTTSVPGVNLGLSQVESPKVGGPTPTFGVDDIDHARSRLESHGVRFDGPTQEIPGMVRLATFYDPDGNTLMLYQSLSPDVP